MVYREDKGVWEEFDPTPPTDRPGNFGQSRWESFQDFLSNLKFQFSKWRWGKTTYTDYLKWFLIPLVTFLLWRIIFSKRRQHKRDESKEVAAPDWPGMDSEFYLLDAKLTAAGLGRFPNEPLKAWQVRLSKSAPDPEKLELIFSIHRRLRFDPSGVTAEDRNVLRNDVANWLKEFEARQIKEQEREELAAR